MKKIIITISALVIAFTMQAQTNNTFFLGHSLINFHVPNMVNKLSIAGSNTFSYDANIGIGAALSWHWNSPTSGQGPQWNLTLPLGGYENFIITEAVPLAGHLLFSNTYRYTDSLYRFANQYNPGIQYYLYETWHCTNSIDTIITGSNPYPCAGDPGSTVAWRTRLTQELPSWESIADSINLIHTNPMYIIPGGQAMGRLSDSINNGALPGLISITDLFDDEYHLDYRGNYFIACVMYSVIHGVSPVGLTNQLTSQFSVPYPIYPTLAQAAKMQEIAWMTVCNYPRSGVNCNVPLGIKDKVTDKNSVRPNKDNNIAVTVHPNPAQNEIQLASSSQILKAEVFNMYSQKILTMGPDTKAIDISMLPDGMYIIQVRTEDGTISQRLLKK